MPRPFGYKMTPQQVDNLSKAVTTAHERRKLGIKKPDKPRTRRERVLVGGRYVLRPEPSEDGCIVLTVAEWIADLGAAETCE